MPLRWDSPSEAWAPVNVRMTPTRNVWRAGRCVGVDTAPSAVGVVAAPCSGVEATVGVGWVVSGVGVALPLQLASRMLPIPRLARCTNQRRVPRIPSPSTYLTPIAETLEIFRRGVRLVNHCASSRLSPGALRGTRVVCWTKIQSLALYVIRRLHVLQALCSR